MHYLRQLMRNLQSTNDSQQNNLSLNVEKAKFFRTLNRTHAQGKTISR